MSYQENLYYFLEKLRSNCGGFASIVYYEILDKDSDFISFTLARRMRTHKRWRMKNV